MVYLENISISDYLCLIYSHIVGIFDTDIRKLHRSNRSGKGQSVLFGNPGEEVGDLSVEPGDWEWKTIPDSDHPDERVS